MSEIFADVVRRFGYRLQGRLFNRPALLASLAGWGQGRGMPIACSPPEVDEAFRREGDFSNAAHADKLVAGEFVIGMHSGPAQAEERATAGFPLSLADFGRLAAEEARQRIALLRGRAGEGFDLVDDYLVFVAWAALRGVFDDASARAIEGCPPGAGRDAALRALFFELRHVGGHLVVGGAAPRRVQVRAGACAAALNERVDRALPTIRQSWGPRCPRAGATAARQATGLMWVGHPATVQAGAFVFQELRSRPEVYAALRNQVQQSGAAAYDDAGVRQQVRGHVLECLRLRPPFPLLPRLLTHDAELQLGARAPARQVAAGRSVYLVVAAALRQAGPGRRGDYDPQEALRVWNSGAQGEGPDALPIFGVGRRSCIAREQVLDTLVSAQIGLLQLPELVYADGLWRRMVYDGPIITRMRLKTEAPA